MDRNRKLTAWIAALVLLMTCIPLSAGAVAELPGLDSRYLLLANAAEPLDASYVPQGLTGLVSRSGEDGVYLASSQSMQLVDTAYQALQTMAEAAESEGVTLYVRQAYRDFADETARYDRLSQRGETADIPGQSDWQTGLAVSVVGKSLRTKTLTAEGYLDTSEGQWVQKNAARFGFILRYPEGKEDITGHAAEPWHLRYVGESAAAHIVENGLTLEEFRAQLDSEAGGFAMPEADALPVATQATVEAIPAPVEAVVAPVEAVVAPVETAAPTLVPETPAPDPADALADAGLPALDSRFLLLANAAEPLSADYVPESLESLLSRRNDGSGVNENGGVYTASSQPMQLTAEAHAALKTLMNAAEAQGVTLYVRQAYRSYAEEETRYERLSQRGEAADVPGQSDWQTGLAVSVVGKSLRTKTLTAEDYLATAEGQWAVQNAPAYGFVLRYPEGKETITGHAAEPWHLRYVGAEAAAYMSASGLTLEELRAAADAVTGGPVMPVSTAVSTPAPASATAAVSAPTPVPNVLPGGLRFIEYADDGDYEYSLFGD